MREAAMKTLTNVPAPVAPAPRLDEPAEQHLLLHDVSWAAYVNIADALPDRRGLRLTYDRGRLEFMTVSPEHEHRKGLLRKLIEVLAEEMGLPARNLGSTTYRREDVDRGLEPDECFYFANQARMRGVRRIDLRRDPPPDLVVEVDVSRSSLDRMGIYQALGVPEVWRCAGAFRMYQLEGGAYQERDRGPTFPAVPAAELTRFLRLGEEDDTTMVRAFRAWVRELLTASGSGETKKVEEERRP
jgi:Uma2 family endonuclease